MHVNDIYLETLLVSFYVSSYSFINEKKDLSLFIFLIDHFYS